MAAAGTDAGGDQGAGEAQEDEERQGTESALLPFVPSADWISVSSFGPVSGSRGLMGAASSSLAPARRRCPSRLRPSSEGAAGGETGGLGLLLEVAVGADVLGTLSSASSMHFAGVGAVDAPVLRPVVDDLLPAGLRLRCEGRRGCCENSRAADKQDDEKPFARVIGCSLPSWGEPNLNGV